VLSNSSRECQFLVYFDLATSLIYAAARCHLSTKLGPLCIVKSDKLTNPVIVFNLCVICYSVK
jgi:hypothetical protein